MADVLFDAEKQAEAPKEASAILRLTRLRRGRVLDAACGVGRHSLAFARRGLQVTGVDQSEAYLQEGRRQARKARLDIDFKRAQLLDLKPCHGAYDLVVNLFTSFGYYATAKQNESALRQMAACVKPGGSLAVEILPRETLDAVFQAQSWQPVPGGYLLQARRYLDGGQRLAIRAVWVQGGRSRVQDSVIQLYTRTELGALFKRAGLRKIRSYGEYGAKPFQVGDRLLMIGSRA